MDDDYFSLNSILADNHKLSCSFTLDVEGLGYLEGGTDNNIHQHSKVELPFWLAQTLSLNEFTTFPLPPPYSNRVKSALNASAQSVKLSNLVGNNGWWYRWGRRIADVLDDEPQADLLNMLLKAFTNRLPALQDLSAHHASADHTLPEGSTSTGELFRDGMEGDERELFAIGQESGKMAKGWYDSANSRKG
ncbi:DNA replication complex GINS protein PSF3 [Kwoniella pini CBS 10737]|uniref:DNA replication complex GINS protein PSF3 n=1 Tax=Kwoniella pini CBS 10737 TaxID=1296096 RepID=A0AAJ8L2L6_9TREE